MRYLVSAMLLVVAVIHLLPLAGVLGALRLAALYGIRFDDPNLVILMRHRAVLFGLLGVFLVFAAFRPSLQPMAFVGGGASVLSFLYLTWSVGGYNAQVSRVFTADLVAGACLLVGALAYAFARREG
ncbi:MAG: phosphopantetheine adenylyltransferase [Blastocatellales bacterium]